MSRNHSRVEMPPCHCPLSSACSGGLCCSLTRCHQTERKQRRECRALNGSGEQPTARRHAPSAPASAPPAPSHTHAAEVNCRLMARVPTRCETKELKQRAMGTKRRIPQVGLGSHRRSGGAALLTTHCLIVDATGQPGQSSGRTQADGEVKMTDYGWAVCVSSVEEGSRG